MNDPLDAIRNLAHTVQVYEKGENTEPKPLRCRAKGCWKTFGTPYTDAMHKADLHDLNNTRHTIRQALIGGLLDGIVVKNLLEKCDKKENGLKGKRWASGERFKEMLTHMRSAHGLYGSKLEDALKGEGE